MTSPRSCPTRSTSSATGCTLGWQMSARCRRPIPTTMPRIPSTTPPTPPARKGRSEHPPGCAEQRLPHPNPSQQACPPARRPPAQNPLTPRRFPDKPKAEIPAIPIHQRLPFAIHRRCDRPLAQPRKHQQHERPRPPRRNALPDTVSQKTKPASDAENHREDERRPLDGPPSTDAAAQAPAQPQPDDRHRPSKASPASPQQGRPTRSTSAASPMRPRTRASRRSHRTLSEEYLLNRRIAENVAVRRHRGPGAASMTRQRTPDPADRAAGPTDSAAPGGIPPPRRPPGFAELGGGTRRPDSSRHRSYTKAPPSISAPADAAF